MSATNRPTCPCPNERCGNTLYNAAYEYRGTLGQDEKFVSVWECTNCMRHTPRQNRHREPNRIKAWRLAAAVRADWTLTDKALQVLVDSGVPNGCQLVHASAFNWHLEQLQKSAKPNTWDIRYHISQAKEDLERAKEFVQEKQNELYTRTTS